LMGKIICGDCLEEMKELGENSVDSVVTDPPYALAFMGKDWDSLKPKEYQEFSREWGERALRVLKPGAYLLAFSGTRTYHRMVVGLEDAGFEIKDQIDWLYGSGFPKSHDISKAIDKQFGKEDEREVIAERPSSWGESQADHNYDMPNTTHTYSKPATSKAKEWNGWGTALKPAHEPIVLAQKPREGTYAENVLEHGVGGLNIDGSRIKTKGEKPRGSGNEAEGTNAYGDFGGLEGESITPDEGRWPANVILDPRSSEMLDGQSGECGGNTGGVFDSDKQLIKFRQGDRDPSGYGDSGGASRFFYCAKAHKSERNAGLEDLEDVKMGQSGGARQKLKEGEDEYQTGDDVSVGLNKIKEVKNDIATLKPINLMRYLVRLVTPANGTVLDPFAGSGTTGCACEVEGFDYILIEKRERFAEVIAPRRCEYWGKEKNWSDLKEHEELPDPSEKKIVKMEAFCE